MNIKLIEAFVQINPNNPKVNYKKGFDTLNKLGEKNTNGLLHYSQ